ncbi:MAG: hypothetical protein JWO37_3996 [Acidimicrobiales bacterium]|nr:hypothetical protein [Acidimicrobiales bacterium]
MNRLAEETSPYLRQHRDNPVDWYPWGDEAFAVARHRDVPIMLSVGYSACHWCHVMAHESFEDPNTAAVMNELFVNVKVDREERPDVDAVYMEAVQALTGHGGWPMTVFLDHDGRPFFGGTYFPPDSRHGLPGWRQLLRAVDEAWRTKRTDLAEQAAELSESLGRAARLAPAPGGLDRSVLDDAVRSLAAQFDPEWGGFGRAPKFPQEMSIELLLRSSQPEAVAMATTTLDAMISGGIYDHLGGGFARYSVDAFWMVPHFEKMLYNQAQLGSALLHAWQVTGEARYRQALGETMEYVLRDLRHRDGGFFSAEDADSEGEEGKFSVWRHSEIEAIAPAAIEHWGVTAGGNFEGANILHLPKRGDIERTPELDEARRLLFDARQLRVRPGLDDKILTEWNGLMIATLAEAGVATGVGEWVDAAVAGGEFLLRSLRRDDGRWLRSWQAEGGARHLAYAADHAALVHGYTRLAEATGQARWIAAARSTADAMLELFWDDEAGGLFTTGHDAERLITRAKDIFDSAIPSANSMAAFALLRLGALTGDDHYRERAEQIIALVAPLAAQHPTAFTQLVSAVDLATAPIDEVAVVGDRPDLVAAYWSRYRPGAVLAWGEPYPSPLFESRSEGLAYVCRGYVCERPSASVEELTSALGG